ncbi:MAG TPA: MurR/RpiR family transcriptional regulator [Chloroflexota bacterium]|nr:MurR/RpiR family transcriptional regulator [Chloroflexota bacterium]
MLNSVPLSDPPRSCLAALRGALPSLSRAERAVAEYILSHPGRAVSASVSDLAKASGSAAGTVMRLCARLGFPGFPELKTALAVDLVQLGAPPSAALEAGQPPEAVIRQVLDLGAASLRETLHALDWDAAAAAGRALAAAARIDVYGAGGISGPLAQLARYRFLLLGFPGAAEVLAPAQLASAQTLRPGDTALALSHSGVAVPILDAVRAAKEAGATVIAITNSHQSPLAEAADIALFTAAHEPTEWAEAPASRLPMFALFEALYAATALARQAGPPSERQK